MHVLNKLQYIIFFLIIIISFLSIIIVIILAFSALYVYLMEGRYTFCLCSQMKQ